MNALGINGEKLKKAAMLHNIIWIVLIYPIAVFYCIEVAYNAEILKMYPDKVIINCILVLIIETGLLIVFHNYKLAMGLLGFAAWVFGLANHYLLQFKGCTLRPVELLGARTALRVARMYEFKLSDKVVVSTIIFLLIICGIKALPLKCGPRAFKKSAVKMAAGIVYFTIFGLYAVKASWDTKLGIDIGPWDSYGVYAKNGSLLAFILEGQEMRVRVPEGYSPQEMEKILGDFDYNINDGLPTVIVVMNESFCDLSDFINLGTEEYMPNWYDIDCVMRGNTYVSVYGGGTCNSEFEFLTGNSLANFPDNIYPYTMYNFENVFNLAEVFKNNNYNTVAIHSADKNNWNRDSVYSQMGFQRFIDEAKMGEISRIRGGVPTDLSNYDKIIEEYEKNEGLSFIFDVTTQNHGGYGDNPGGVLNRSGWETNTGRTRN